MERTKDVVSRFGKTFFDTKLMKMTTEKDKLECEVVLRSLGIFLTYQNPSAFVSVFDKPIRICLRSRVLGRCSRSQSTAPKLLCILFVFCSPRFISRTNEIAPLFDLLVY